MFNARTLKKIFILALGSLSLIGACLLLLATSPWGIHLDDNAIAYLLMARLFMQNTLNQGLLGQFLCHFMPLYPYVLSCWHITTAAFLDGARFFHAILFALNILLIGIITQKYTGSLRLGLSAPLLFLSAPDILEIHSTLASEPLFIFFMLLWVLSFFAYLKSPGLPVLILSSTIVTLASMTRFAGIPLVLTGLWAILFLNQKKNPISKYRHALIFIIPPCLSMFLWGRYSYIENAQFQRHFHFHPVSFSYLQKICSVFYSWFLPSGVYVPEIEKTLLVIAAMVFCLVRLLRWHQANKDKALDPARKIFIRFSLLGIAFIGLYVGCLFLAASFYDIDMIHSLSRYLLLVHIISLILLCGFMTNLLQGNTSSFKIDTAKIILTYLFLFYIVQSTHYLTHPLFNKDRYTNNPCRYSLIMKKIKALPTQTPIYSNNFLAIYFWDDKFSSFIPFFKEPLSGEMNDRYSSQLSQMMIQLRERNGILVYFNKEDTWEVKTFDEYTENLQELEKRIPLHLMARDRYVSVFDVR